jgi:hypothetical protein
MDTDGMSKIIERLAGEPVAVRGAIAAVLNLLVVSGVIDTGASEAVEAAVLGVVSLFLIVSARQRVTPV